MKSFFLWWRTIYRARFALGDGKKVEDDKKKQPGRERKLAVGSIQIHGLIIKSSFAGAERISRARVFRCQGDVTRDATIELTRKTNQKSISAEYFITQSNILMEM